ncbi:UDP-glucosyltransferase 2 [Lucilia cuprina]|uniref:UDP-glucosyltransferase 2 n=1 Tax=Lucilia cuprina TaxID=7375 RepID=UPI001F06AC5F|nr:UDP-glucosyltransferase 2 [Lucilia cuprina]
MSFKLYTTLLLLIFAGSYQSTQAAEILALFINGHQSHLLVYASVVNLLLQRGHQVTVVTTLDVAHIIDVQNIRWLKLSENYTETVITTGSKRMNSFNKLERMFNRIENTSKFMKDPQWVSFLNEDNNYDLLILGYLFNDYQLGVSAHFKCPVVLIWTSQPIGFVQSLMGNPEERWYVSQPYDSHQYNGVKAIAFGWFEKFVELLALDRMQEIYTKYFPANYYPSFKEIRKTVSLVLCNHHSLSEGPIAPFLPGIIEIGGIENKFVSQRNQMNLSDFITSKQKIIYFSFGSRVKWSLLPESLEQIFIETFKVFSNYTVLWTYDKNCTKLEMQFPYSNVKCQAWWPQSSILNYPQTKLFITHGGKGSITESQLYGVPMLGIPFFGDQKVNVDKMVNKGFGLKLDLRNITYENMVVNIKQILDCAKYVNNIRIFSELYHDRPISNEQNAVYWLEYVLRYKGAEHLKSPVLQLNFFQYYLLDVYSLILVGFIIIVSILNILEKKIMQQ